MFHCAGFIEALAYLVEKLAADNNVALPLLRVATETEASTDDPADKEYRPGREETDEDSDRDSDEDSDEDGDEDGQTTTAVATGRTRRGRAQSGVLTLPLPLAVTPPPAEGRKKPTKDTQLTRLTVTIADAVDLGTMNARRSEFIK